LSAFWHTGNGQSAIAHCFDERLYQPDLPVRLILFESVITLGGNVARV
jgi:hypothetical protein